MLPTPVASKTRTSYLVIRPYPPDPNTSAQRDHKENGSFLAQIFFSHCFRLISTVCPKTQSLWLFPLQLLKYWQCLYWPSYFLSFWWSNWLWDWYDIGTHPPTSLISHRRLLWTLQPMCMYTSAAYTSGLKDKNILPGYQILPTRP